MSADRTIVFFDGQNLYHAAREAWAPIPPVAGNPYSYPSYDVEELAQHLVARVPGRTLTQIRFYTGVPDVHRSVSDAFWHGFWSNKLRYLGSRGIYVYRGRVNVGGQEKGVDVSLAIDLVRLAYEHFYDVAVIVSQDWDFGPAAALVKEIARNQKRSVELESAFVVGRRRRYGRGVPGTRWVHIDKWLYDLCFDPIDYRP